MLKLLTKNNAKTKKGEGAGYMTYILHLAPSDLSGAGNTCPKATPGCKLACLNTAGRGGMFKPGTSTNVVQQARIRKTQWFFADRDGFMTQLAQDIAFAIRQATKKGLTPVFRLNGTSDLAWEKYPVPGTMQTVFEMFPTVQFYDYTKITGRKVGGIKNYHLTFSNGDGNEKDVAKVLGQGMNVAVVFNKLPAKFMNREVFNGDESDLRFMDPKGVVVGLKAKGRAKKDTTGFVVFLKQA